MAYYDNKHWILSNTRNAFRDADDTGMCEVVMASDNLATQIPMGKYDCYSSQDGSDDDTDTITGSFEIHSDIQFGLGLRHRSNTAQCLDRMEEVKKNAANIHHVKWVVNPVPLTDDEKAELFPRRDLSKSQGPKVSLLTELLERYPNQQVNPFQVYAKFDGNAQVGVATKRYGIFITMLSENDRNFPMRVVIISTAKVMDLIGLICWKCSNEYPDIILKDSVNFYGLYIAEDDGEVDWDFPCLDSKEYVSKFGFNFLALVERDTSQQPSEDPMPSAELTPFPQENPAISNRAQQQIEDDLRRMKTHMTAIEAPVFQSYNVQMINKMRVRADVHLGISGEKIEIDPVVQHKVSSKLWGKPRIISHTMDIVAACDLIEHKSNNRAVFRVVYYHRRDDAGEGTFKHHEFEAEAPVAAEIVQKVNHILEPLQSPRRKEYIILRERKAHRRKSFYLGPR